MRRSIALAVVAVLVVAGFAGPRLFDDDEATRSTDPSRPYASELNDQGKVQAEQLEAAMESVREQAEAFANPHELVVTVRDELPLVVWDDNCRMTASAPPTLGVFTTEHKPISGPVPLPASAKKLSSGGCEATVTVNVPNSPAYNVSLAVEGRGVSDGTERPAIKREGASQKVTIVE